MPHQESSHKLWEARLPGVIGAVFEGHLRPLFSLLAGRAGTVSEISRAFRPFAAKHTIANIILYHTLKAPNAQYGTGLSLTVEWPRSKKGDLARLEILHRAIAPSLVVSYQSDSTVHSCAQESTLLDTVITWYPRRTQLTSSVMPNETAPFCNLLERKP